MGGRTGATASRTGGGAAGWTLAFVAALLLAVLASCRTPAPPPEPVRMTASFDSKLGRSRAAGPFEPEAATSRFCRFRSPSARVGFDGRWTAAVSATCDQRRRYGDCICLARAAFRSEGETLLESGWKRFEVSPGSGWNRLELSGEHRALRLSYPELDSLILELRETE